MNFKLELGIGLRYLQSKKKEAFISITSLLSLFGIMLGVAALIVVMSVMNGYKVELTKKLKGFNSDIIIRNFEGNITDYQVILDKIKKEKFVVNALPVISEQSLLLNEEKATGALIKAIRPEDIKCYPFLHGQKLSYSNAIILGQRLARMLGVAPGDTIKLVSTHFDSTMIGMMPRMKNFYVEGVFSSGLSEYDAGYAIMSMNAGQKMFDTPGTVNSIELFLSPDVDLDKVVRNISNLLDNKYQVLDWKRMNQALFDALKTERAVMFIILTFIIIVAAFNIISSLTMLVTNKSKEIAILRTMGLSRGGIMRIFLYAGMILGLCGTLLGVLMGLAFAYNIEDIKNFLSAITGTNLFDPLIYYLEILPSKTDKFDVLRVIGLSLVISFFATLYPSYKASIVSPVEGLKND
jgi:lipoprotein-releasing system permease protein